MKPCSTTIVVLCALFFSSASFGEENPTSVLTALSSTTISGYIRTSGHLQRHVCRPVRPVRVHRLYKLSNGVIREFGYTVRCRHGVVYLPNGRIAELLPAPNRSSRFSSDATTPRIDDRTAVILIEARRVEYEYRLPPGTLPPGPPYRGTNHPPVIVSPPRMFSYGYSGSGSVSQIREIFDQEHYLRRRSPEFRAAVEEFIRRQNPDPHVTLSNSSISRRFFRSSGAPSLGRFVREPH